MYRIVVKVEGNKEKTLTEPFNDEKVAKDVASFIATNLKKLQYCKVLDENDKIIWEY